MKPKLRPAILALAAAAAVAAAAALAGCSTPATRINANAQLFNSIAPASQELIKKGQIALGFTPDMVLLALGKPDVITQHADASGTTEIWRYQSLDNNTTAVVYANYGYGGYGYGGYGGWWGGPMYSPVRGWNMWGYPAIGWSTTATDYIRINFRDGRVTEINRAR